MLHVLEIANLLFFAAILLGHLACDLLLKCKKCKKLNLSDIVFSTAAFPKMPNGLSWNLVYKPEKGEITGFNIVNNGLKNTNWKDKKSGKILSRKRAPKTMRDFAQLNKPEQSHILLQIFEALPLAYNKSLDQYGKQFQRYMKKLYKQQFEMCTPAQQLKLGEPLAHEFGDSNLHISWEFFWKAVM